MILRKVWGSVWNRSNSGKDLVSHQRAMNHVPPPLLLSSSSSLGAFDQLPMDIIVQILMMMEPRDAVKLGLTCKAWKCVAGGNRLWIFYLQCSQEPWDSIFFAETSLRSGYPLRMISSQSGELSFMHIYSQRAQVPGSIIIDGGSGYCKFGWSKYASPSGRSATFLEFGNIESPIYARLQQFFATIFTRMQVKPSMQPIVVSLPLCHFDDTESARASRRQLKTAILNVLFDMNVPAVCAVNQAVLALYAARRTSGIVVNIGFQVITILPILHGKVMRQVGVEVISFGALKLTGFLKEKMQENNISFQSLYTVRTLKEKLCYVALDYKDELSKDTQASVEVSGEGWFTLSKERFQTGEILFQPRLAGMRAMSLHQAVSLCMDHCDAAGLTGDDSWFKTVVLTGGSSCLPGLAERLERELHEHLPSYISNGVRVIPPPCGVDTSWHGAKLISNLSTFPGPWCITRKQFRRKSRLMW
ncbi:Actin family [Arabidopsis thaliana x Arabidopsis arenosa]|uniref:Actin family n=1 Tax=Arabidopsis thaliana x Arabidopsis arenosa TaxID=1240361 RepID=A0A8T1XJF8_9BRAS|nr:Actin family [Arabidopsis thaliana x Arabidopsis arenosa]